MTAHLIEVQEIPESDLGRFYSEKRISILQDCAMIRPDIYWWRCRRFDASCSTYHTAQQTDKEREQNAFVHLLYPHQVPLSKDQRTLKQKTTHALEDLANRAKHGMA
jgi:hypothetical protein